MHHIAQHLIGDAAPGLASETLVAIERHLGADYDWPGNVRELEQCVRNVLVRKEYIPHRKDAAFSTDKASGGTEHGTGRTPTAADAAASLLAEMQSGVLTADDLLRRYCTIVYARTGSYEAAAQRLKLDRRTVKSKVDPQLLASLRDPACASRAGAL